MNLSPLNTTIYIGSKWKPIKETLRSKKNYSTQNKYSRSDNFSPLVFKMSKVKSPWSRVQSPESRVQSPESSVQCPVSTVQSPESRVQSPESRVQSPESRVQSPESRVQSPESSPAIWIYPCDYFSSTARAKAKHSSLPTLLRFGLLRSLADNILLAISTAVPKRNHFPIGRRLAMIGN